MLSQIKKFEDTTVNQNNKYEYPDTNIWVRQEVLEVLELLEALEVLEGLELLEGLEVQ